MSLQRILLAGVVAIAGGPLASVSAGAQYYLPPPPPPRYVPPPTYVQPPIYVQPPVYAPAGCVYYEHRDFGGQSFALNGPSSRNYVGDYWNDKISSIACSPGCYVTVWEHAYFGGRSWRVGGRVPWVGAGWNDRISSLSQSC
ncbi:MAG: peptidase inhibitor family I36 protein [Bauldia sp.]